MWSCRGARLGTPSAPGPRGTGRGSTSPSRCPRWSRPGTSLRPFDLGTTDYLVKPSSPVGLAAWIRGGPAPPGAARTVGALRAGRSDHRLCPAPGEPGRATGAAHRHRVPDPIWPSFGQRRTCGELRAPAATGLEARWRRRRSYNAHRHQQPAPQAGRRCPASHRHLHPAPRSATGCPRGMGLGRQRRSLSHTPLCGPRTVR